MTLFDEPIYAPETAIWKDKFYTPPIAVKPLLPFLGKKWKVWEPCCGAGALVNALRCGGICKTFGTDIREPYGRDFLTWEPEYFDAIVTNPPYSQTDAFLERAYSLGRPFAFLIPVRCLGGKRRQVLYRQYGVEIVLLGERINFLTPTGKGHKSGSSAQFEVAWFTWGLCIGQALTFGQI